MKLKTAEDKYKKLCIHCGKVLSKPKGAAIEGVAKSKQTIFKQRRQRSCMSCYLKGKSNLRCSLINFAMPRPLRNRDPEKDHQLEVSKTNGRTKLFKKYKSLEEPSNKNHICSICKKTFKYKYSLSDHFLQEHSTDSGQQMCPICSKKYDTHQQLSSHIEWCHNPNSIKKLKDPTATPQIKIARLKPEEISSFMKKVPTEDAADKHEPKLPKTRLIPRLTQEDLHNLPKPIIKLNKIRPENLTSKLNKTRKCKVVLKKLDKQVVATMLTQDKPEKSSSKDEAIVVLPETDKRKPTISRRESWTCDTELHKELRGFDELGIEHDEHSLVLSSADKLSRPEVLSLDNNNIKMKWMNGLLSNITRPRSDFKKTMTDILDKICPEVKPRNILYE